MKSSLQGGNFHLVPGTMPGTAYTGRDEEERTKYLESLGYRVARFWNNDVVKDVDNVARAILYNLEAEPPLQEN